jgi:hypothetical protein
MDLADQIAIWCVAAHTVFAWIAVSRSAPEVPVDNAPRLKNCPA